MNTINEKIKELNKQEGKKFNKVLIKNLHDKYWCRMHKIDDISPDFQTAREKTYQEMYER